MTLSEVQRLIDLAPFHDWLQPVLEAVDEQGGVELRLPFRPEFRRSRDRDDIHGGVIAALADIACHAAAAGHAGRGLPTIDIRVDYLRGADGTDLLAHARVLKAGRTIAVSQVDIKDQRGRLIAVGRGCFLTLAVPPAA